MAELTEIFTGVAAVNLAAATWEAADGTHEVAVEYATASYMPVLGLGPR
jgi:hypothetical protein